MGLYKKKQVKELYWMKHFYDNNPNGSPENKEEKILTSSLSPFIYYNENMEEYLTKLAELTYITYEQHNVVRNFKNICVDKNFDNHRN